MTNKESENTKRNTNLPSPQQQILDGSYLTCDLALFPARVFCFVEEERTVFRDFWVPGLEKEVIFVGGLSTYLSEKFKNKKTYQNSQTSLD